MVLLQLPSGGWPHLLASSGSGAANHALGRRPVEATGTALLVAALASAASHSALLGLSSAAAARFAAAAERGFTALSLMLTTEGGLGNVAPAHGTLLLGTLKDSAAGYDAERLGEARADVALGGALLAATAISLMRE